MVVAAEKRHALRYKPALVVRATYEWLEPAPMRIEGAITDFSVAGVALQHGEASEPSDLAAHGQLCLRLGYANERFDVTLARVIRKCGGHWLAGLSFAKRTACRRRARGLIEHLKTAYRAGAVQVQATPVGPVATVVGNLNFNVVVSLHHMLRASQPPQLIDLSRCTGADHAGIDCLLLARDQGISLKFDASDRIAALLQRPLSRRTLDAPALARTETGLLQL